MAFAKRATRLPFVWRAAWRDRQVRRRHVPYLAIVAIFRDEAPFLHEWLTFHAGVGVEHFYLYDNFSADRPREVLAPWIARGLVTLIDWPVQTGQLAAYRHCIRAHAMQARWMAFIDIDEFLFSPEGADIRAVLRDCEDLPGVVVHSPYFGASGLTRRPPVPITRSLTRRAPLSLISAKTVANPRWIRRIGNVHLFNYWRGEGRDTDRRTVGQGSPPLRRLRLNHYWSRSLADLRDKIARGDASTPQRRDPAWHMAFEQRLNAEQDTSILPILDRLFGA